MRLNINLATQPYEDARRFAERWALIIGGLLVLAIALSIGTYRTWQSHRATAVAVEREQKTLDGLDLQQAQDLQILNKPQNREVHEKSEFLNELIRRKEISWTKVFSDLERIMPPRIRVLSVEPKIEGDEIVLSMILGGESRERAVELVHRMEQTRTFRYPRIESESDQRGHGPQQQSAPDPMKFQISAEYVPQALGQQSEADTSAGSGK